jgi:F-type H+-transporting ATPase subunit delta
VKDTTVAARYARALFMVTEKRGETARALEDLKSLLQVLGPGTSVGDFLAMPQTRLQEKREVLRKGFQGRVLPIVAVFIDLLLRKKRLGELETVVNEFEALVEKALGIKRATVVSAVALDSGEVGRLHEVLERATRSHIKLNLQVDPELVGGALVRIGDRVIDRSVRTLLESIEKQLYEASV